MNNFTSRPCELQQDHQKIRDFWLDYAAFDVRCYPTIWRILLLLTSRVNNPEKDTRIWEDASGQIAAFAMLWRRQTTSPYIVLDCFANPSFVTEDLLLEILRWGDQRTHALSGEQKSELTVIANGFSQYGFGDGLLRQLDFTPVIPDANEHNVYFAKSSPEPRESQPLRFQLDISSVVCEMLRMWRPTNHYMDFPRSIQSIRKACSRAMSTAI